MKEEDEAPRIMRIMRILKHKGRRFGNFIILFMDSLDSQDSRCLNLQFSLAIIPNQGTL